MRVRIAIDDEPEECDAAPVAERRRLLMALPMPRRSLAHVDAHAVTRLDPAELEQRRNRRP